jgi:hypothetical protein
MISDITLAGEAYVRRVQPHRSSLVHLELQGSPTVLGRSPMTRTVPDHRLSDETTANSASRAISQVAAA